MVVTAPTVIRSRRDLSSGRGRPGASSARRARRAGGAARRATGRRCRRGRRRRARPGTTYQLPSSISPIELLGAPAGVPGEDPQPVEAAVEQLDRGVEVDQAEPAVDRAEADRHVLGGRAAAATASAPSVLTGPPWKSTSGSATTSPQPSSTSATGTAEGRLRTTPRAPLSSTSSSSTTVSAKLGSSSAGVATSSIPAPRLGHGPIITQTEPGPTQRECGEAAGGTCRSGAAGGQAARAALSRSSRPARGSAGRRRAVRRPGALLDLGADAHGGGVRGARPGRPSRRAGSRSLAVGPGHRLGHRRRRRASARWRSRIARTPGSSSAVACQAATTAASRSSGWSISSRSIRPARRVCQRSWRAPSRVELVAEGLGDAGDVHRQRAVAAGVGAGDHVAEDLSAAVEGRPGHGAAPSGGGLTYRGYVLTVCNRTDGMQASLGGDPAHRIPTGRS